MGTVQQWFNRGLAAIKSITSDPTLGQQAELMAAQYLRQQGLKQIAKNYRTKAGEIDLIMRDNDAWVFVEVKYRSHEGWASAAEAVTRDKQYRIINAAKQYLQQRKIYDQVDCRFDVVAIDGELDTAKINWIPHAFY